MTGGERRGEAALAHALELLAHLALELVERRRVCAFVLELCASGRYAPGSLREWPTKR